jgi:hypothetical protein
VLDLMRSVMVQFLSSRVRGTEEILSSRINGKEKKNINTAYKITPSPLGTLSISYPYQETLVLYHQHKSRNLQHTSKFRTHPA